MRSLYYRFIELKNNDGLRSGLLYSIYSFINKGFSFILVLILVNFITPSEYGTLNLFGTVTMVVGYFIALSADNYLSVAYFNDGIKGLRKTISCVFYTTLFMSAIFCVIAIVGGNTLADLLDLPFESLLFAICICCFNVYHNLNLDYNRIKQNLKRYGVLSITNAFLNLIISIIFVKSFSLGWEGRVYSQALCCLAYGLYALLNFYFNGFITKPDMKYWKEIILWGLPLIPHIATNFIRQGCDRYIINNYYSLDEVGLFSFSLNLANILILIGIGFNQANSIDIYKILGSNNLDASTKFKRISHQNYIIRKIYIICALTLPVISICLIPIYLPTYKNCIYYIPLLSLCAFLNCLYFLYTNFLFFYKRTKIIMTITVLSSLIHLLLSLLFTRYSLFCTCCIYCISQLLILVMIKYYSNKELHSHIIV